jgi:endonuclease/exonuclease/phosphatase (EEP) superfamily protein YafD
VVVVNVLHDNEQYEDLARLLRAEKPDIVALIEYSRTWQSALSEFHAEYPYRGGFAAGASGIALWFRHRPIRIDRPEWLASTGNSSIHAVFEFAGKARHVWAVHPTSPLYRVGVPGNPEMSAIARRVRETGGSRIVVGDLNCTDGSEHFWDFLRETGLRDSRLGFGRQASWSTDNPYRIAIDHAFVSGDLAVVDRRLGPKVGSDHFPLIFELAPAAMNADAHGTQASTASR